MFAATNNDAAPIAIKSVDAQFTRFIRDINGFSENPTHYYDNALVAADVPVAWSVNVYWCPGTNTFESFMAGLCATRSGSSRL